MNMDLYTIRHMHVATLITGYIISDRNKTAMLPFHSLSRTIYIWDIIDYLLGYF